MDDEQLDVLLATWASEQQISQPQADEILQAITCDAPAGLPATWWIDLSAQVSAAMVLAASRPPTPSGLPGALYFTDAA